MNKVIDLGDEFDAETWDDSQSESNVWKVQEERSIRETFGWGADYLSMVNPGAVIVGGSRSRLTDNVLQSWQQYWELTVDAWGIDHQFPRFTATERVATNVLYGRRNSDLASLRLTTSDVREIFDRSRAAWQLQSEMLSSLTDIVLIPDYQRIIGLGPSAIPLIIEALRQEVDHWFWALTSIVGHDHAEGAQTMQEAAERWISWYDALVSDE